MEPHIAVLVTFFGTIGLCAFAWFVPSMFARIDRATGVSYEQPRTDSVFFHYADSRKGGSK